MPKVISLVNKLEHRLGYVNSFHVLSQMAVSSVGSLEQQQNVESRLAFEDLGLEPHISWPIELLFHAHVKECSKVQPFLHLTFFFCATHIFDLRDHSFKTSACLRGGGVKNWPNLPTDSSKKLPTEGG